MSLLENNVLDISLNHYKYLLNLQNVNGIGVGYKNINNVTTKEICLNVFVNEKVSSSYLSKNNVIPKEYMGIKTDVIKTGIPKKRMNTSYKIFQKFRPLIGGASISVGDNKTEGTLGCIVVKRSLFKSEYFILINNHVLANNNELPIETRVIQPTETLGGHFPIAYLTNYVPIRFSTKDNEIINYVDCAIAKILESSLVSKKIFEIGKIKGVSKAILDLDVKKVGFVTGLTKGKVIATNVTTTIGDGEDYELYQKQTRASLYNDHGDSGSIILNNKNEAVGLLMAGPDDGSNVVFNDISLVLESLKVKIYM